MPLSFEPSEEAISVEVIRDLNEARLIDAPAAVLCEPPGGRFAMPRYRCGREFG